MSSPGERHGVSSGHFNIYWGCSSWGSKTDSIGDVASPALPEHHLMLHI